MPLKHEFKQIENGPLALWSFPEKDTRYTMGIDAATGVGQDWTVFQVLCNRQPFEQVARYRAKVDTVAGSRAMVELGRYYNNAMLVIETRFPGNAYADAAAVQYRYPKLYRKDEYMDIDPNVSDKFGITTTQPDKWRFIREITEQFAAGNFIPHLNDPITLDEILNYIYIEDKSKTGAAQGLNDDCVDALMLAVHGVALYPQDPKAKQKKRLTEEVAHQRYLMDKFAKRLKQGEPIQVL
jgi:hypothetical protein